MRYNKRHHIQYLLVEKITGYISSENDRWVQKTIDGDEEVRALWEDLKEKHALKGELFFNSLDEDKAWSKIEPGVKAAKKEKSMLHKYKHWLAVAAVILVVLTIGVKWMVKR